MKNKLRLFVMMGAFVTGQVFAQEIDYYLINSSHGGTIKMQTRTQSHYLSPRSSLSSITFEVGERVYACSYSGPGTEQYLCYWDAAPEYDGLEFTNDHKCQGVCKNGKQVDSPQECWKA
jgi:hypothetical protein